jgi:hypothetical protein
MIFVLSFLVLWFAARIGVAFRQKNMEQDRHQDFELILASILTLLGLIIGFSFSMAVSRYDQRKNYEEEEANAIGTEYVRADLLPAADAARAHTLLKAYLDQRLLFYTLRDEPRLHQVDVYTAQLQNELWSVAATSVRTLPAPVAAIVLSGMNDVLNRQGYTLAAWRNRIPGAAWVLMLAIAILCNLLIGYGAHRRYALLFLILPLALSISFFLIADIDSPRGGAIRIYPQNLEGLSQSLPGQQ